MKIYVIIICIAISKAVVAQNGSTDWRLFNTSENKEVDTTNDTILVEEINNYKLNYNSDSGTVTVYEDPRIKELSTFMGTPQKPENEVLIEGFRIQIFFSQSREEAQKAEKEFKRKNKDIKTYIDFDAPPNHRLRVGNFRTKLQALKFQK